MLKPIMGGRTVISTQLHGFELIFSSTLGGVLGFIYIKKLI
jgi:hypothetical protein